MGALVFSFALGKCELLLLPGYCNDGGVSPLRSLVEANPGG